MGCMSTTSEIISVLPEFAKKTSSFLTNIALFRVANTVDKDTLLHLPIPALSDLDPLLSSIPFLGILFGSLKILNACRSYYTEPAKADDIYEDKDKDEDKDSLITGICGRGRKPPQECDTNAKFELASGAALISLCSIALYSSTTAFAYGGFAISSWLDLIRASGRAGRTYLDQEVPEKTGIYHTALFDLFISLLKCAGWTILFFGTIAGAGALTISIGWILIGAAAAVQPLRHIGNIGLYGSRLFNSCPKEKEAPEEKKLEEEPDESDDNPKIAASNETLRIANASRPFL